MAQLTPIALQDGNVLNAADANTPINSIITRINTGMETDNIVDLAITTAKIANNAVTGDKIAMGSDVAGDIVYYNGTDYARLAIGTASQLLRTNSGATAPEWVTFDDSLQPDGAMVQLATTQTGANTSGTGTIPLDDTIPQNTEGNEFMTLAITPKSTTNKLIINVQAIFDISTGVEVIGALFQDSTANALAASVLQPDNSAGLPGQFFLTHTMAAGTISSTTFKFRAGLRSAGTIYFNADSTGTRLFGGVSASSIVITEVKAS